MLFNREDFSQFNTAKSPWYQIDSNGKVDIGLEQGNGQKLGLSADGMFKLVTEWLASYSPMPLNEQKAIVDIVNMKQNKRNT